MLGVKAACPWPGSCSFCPGGTQWGEGSLGKVKADRCEMVGVPLSVSPPSFSLSLTPSSLCHDSQSMVQGLRAVPKTVPGASQVRNYFSNNMKQLLAFSFSFSHKCSVVVPRDYMMYNFPTCLQKQI